MTIERDGGSVVAASKLFYDGAAFTGLPLGQATRGVLARREALAFTDDLVNDLYGGDVPDLGSLGYFHVIDSALGPGWWILETSQQTDARGNPRVRREALGHDVTMEFDAHGIYPVRLTNALGQVITSEFDYRHGQMNRQIARDGGESRWVFDLHGRLVEVFEPQDSDGLPSTMYERAPFESPPRVKSDGAPLRTGPHSRASTYTSMPAASAYRQGSNLAPAMWR